jgi:hypothetical protein
MNEERLLTDKEILERLQMKDMRSVLMLVLSGEIPRPVLGSTQHRRGPKNRRWRWSDFEAKWDKAKRTRERC